MAAVDAFEVLRPGILTIVQDLGRSGFARYGVAPSGALDGFALLNPPAPPKPPCVLRANRLVWRRFKK